MKVYKQDGKASIPEAYRSWILRNYGEQVMLRLDEIGAEHDSDILIMGWGLANHFMRYEMKESKLPFWSIRLPISIGIFVYRWTPQKLKNLYWK